MYEVLKFETAESFLEELQSNRWSEGHALTNWYFRGHGNADWSLLPCAHRQSSWAPYFKDLVQHMVDKARARPSSPDLSSGSEVEDRRVFTNAVVQAQATLVTVFVNQLEKFGERVPDHDAIPHWLEEMTRLTRHGLPHELRPTDSVAMARHHGIPTNLLDWSTRPRVAAFFAARSCLEEVQKPRPKPIEWLCVWGLHKSWVSYRDKQATDEDPIVLIPYQGSHASNPFARAQAGYFTLDMFASKRYRSNGRWIGLEEWLEVPRECFRKLMLRADQADALLRELYYDDVTASALMPDRDKVAEDAIRIASWYKDWLVSPDVRLTNSDARARPTLVPRAGPAAANQPQPDAGGLEKA